MRFQLPSANVNLHQSAHLLPWIKSLIQQQHLIRPPRLHIILPQPTTSSSSVSKNINSFPNNSPSNLRVTYLIFPSVQFGVSSSSSISHSCKNKLVKLFLMADLTQQRHLGGL
ncbi:hypothetical protein ATANTOWER_011489 [Ataeniobius toweri]|uniref:Uncharacterized protein n=1 Tax=Ataeniobius toweri TaxID=208326 RepID=A0ABU7BY26_9TELE|nr:hypothetical protein [Ataeniobius toweri]